MGLIKYVFIATIILFQLSSCDKEDNISKATGSIVFGLYAPFCVDECTNLYLFENNKIYEQVKSIKNHEEVAFEDSSMSGPQADTLISFINTIPTEISQSESGILGCPGCHDQPIIYFKFSNIDGSVKEILVDTDEIENPLQLKVYVSRLYKFLSK